MTDAEDDAQAEDAAQAEQIAQPDNVAQAEHVAQAVADAHRHGWAYVLAATVRVAQDLDLAEECVQEAYAAALATWARDGIPAKPAAWLITTAKRRAIDAIRRERTFRSKLPLLIEPEEPTLEESALGESALEERALQERELEESEFEPSEFEDGAHARREDSEATVPDERLRLIFTCCHPALAQEAQLALTLRLVCGLSTPDTARMLLVSEPTMAARITRAKKKISAARIPFRVPREAELPDRLSAVLGVVYLLFTAGHTAPSGPDLMRTELTDRALHLARVLRDLMPDEPEVRGLLALLLVTDARRATRTDADGALLRLEDQNRSLWDGEALAEAHELIVAGLRGGRVGRYLLQAAIASLYAQAPTYEETDWPQLVALYDRLLTVWPSPTVALTRTVPLSMVQGPEVALDAIAELEKDSRLSRYPYLPAIKADLLHRLGRDAEAATAYRQALELTENEAERAFLAGRAEDTESRRRARAQSPDTESRRRAPIQNPDPESGDTRLTRPGRP